jgi:hypothetical protein
MNKRLEEIRNFLSEEYCWQRNWPTKSQWIERKGDLDSRMSYEVRDLVDEAFCDGWDACQSELLPIIEEMGGGA